jgi:hypothetical protein
MMLPALASTTSGYRNAFHVQNKIIAVFSSEKAIKHSACKTIFASIHYRLREINFKSFHFSIQKSEFSLFCYHKESSKAFAIPKHCTNVLFANPTKQRLNLTKANPTP